MSTRVFHPVSCLWVLHSAAAAAMLILASRGLLSSDPLAALNSTSVRLIRLIDDFLIHLSVYTTITMILLPLVIKHRTGIQRVLVGSIMFHALATELLQRTIPRRACDPIDMAANLLGIALGIRLASHWPQVLTVLRRLTARAVHQRTS